MDSQPAEQALKELFPYLDDLETRSLAILQLLQEQDGITDEQLASHLDRAAKISNVKWRAARIRIEHLLAPPVQDRGQSDKTPAQKEETPQPRESANPAASTEQRQEAKSERRPDKNTEQQPSSRNREGTEQAPEKKNETGEEDAEQRVPKKRAA